ncbi:MAG: hypothetical protein OXH15_05825 [Gammaproteobacteria bacterium]|nr:hypothetical protein [Gammaproteobacteria bacterium]
MTAAGWNPLRSAALTDVVFLVEMAPSSLAPVTIPEMHLYAYLGNLVALKGGVPVADWGYGFAVTADGFPFADALDFATSKLIQRSIVVSEHGALQRGEELFAAEVEVLNGLVQSARRKEWLRGSLACALQLPNGAVRDAINHSPGVANNLRHGRAAGLLRKAEVEEIYDEFALVEKLLGPEAEERLQAIVVWLSARVVSDGRP